MPAKIIVSYDGTANEDDAIALGRLFARAGAEVSLAYVRHTHEPDRDRETLVQHEAQELLERGAERFGGAERRRRGRLVGAARRHRPLDARRAAHAGRAAARRCDRVLL
jgi:hypothetical protein